MDLIMNGDFVTISTNKFFKEFGVKKGRVAYVAGHRALPMNERDPYTQRVKFIVALCSEDGHIDTSGRHYLMDPRSLTKIVDPEALELLRAIYEEDFSPPDEEPEQLSLPLDAAIN
jgi:hypothetical protein